MASVVCSGRRLLAPPRPARVLGVMSASTEPGADPTGRPPESPLDEIIRDPSRRDDPWTLYRQIRDEHPIYAFPEWGSYLLTRWDDCERVLRDPKFSSDMTRRELPAGHRTGRGRPHGHRRQPGVRHVALPGPARPHAHPWPGVEGLHSTHGRTSPTPHQRDLRRGARRGRRDGRARRREHARLPGAVDGDLRAHGRAAVGPRPVRAVGCRRVPDAGRGDSSSRPSSRPPCSA